LKKRHTDKNRKRLTQYSAEKDIVQETQTLNQMRCPLQSISVVFIHYRNKCDLTQTVNTFGGFSKIGQLRPVER